MATGFDTRNGGRDSFASPAPAIKAIGRGTLSGESRGAQVVGGDAIGQGQNDIHITTPTTTAGDLGKFFGEAAKPYVEKRSQEKFFEGFTRAQSGESIAELHKSHGAFDKIFGPNDFEKGAIFYTAMTGVDKWQQTMMDNSDELMKLSPEDQAKHMADTSRSLMGADRDVNQIIQKQIIDKTGPMVDILAKKRYVYGQGVARDSMFGSLDAAGTTLQTMTQHNATVTAPTDAETTGMQVSTEQFKSMLQQPHGMDDATYQGVLGDYMVHAAQKGQFAGYEALASAGILDHLKPDDQKRVTDAYEGYSTKALSDAKGTHIAEALDIEARIKKATSTDPKVAAQGYSPLQAVQAYDKLNAQIARETGIRKRAWDTGELTATGKGVISDIAEGMKRQEGWAHDRDMKVLDHKLTEQDKVADEQRQLAGATDALNLGQAKRWSVSGGDTGALNKAFYNAYAGGNFAAISRSVEKEQYVNENVANAMQAKLTSAGGQDFTGEAQQGYKEWQAMMKVSPAAAAAYYGPQQVRLLNMQRLINSNNPVGQAYVRAFGDTDAGRYSGATLGPEYYKEGNKAVAAEVAKADTTWGAHYLGFSRRPMGTDVREGLSHVLTESTAVAMKNTDLPIGEVVPQMAAQALSSNLYEFHGGNIGWRNRPGTPPLSKVLGLPDDKLDGVMRDVVDSRLKGAGYKDGADGTYEIFRLYHGNKVILNVIPTDSTSMVTINEDELRSHIAVDAAKEVKHNQPTSTLHAPKGTQADIRSHQY